MSSWVEPLGDEGRRVVIPHATAASQAWTLDAGFTFFEGRTYPVGARGEHVTTTWSLSAIWGTGERSAAEDLLQLLRDVAQEPDARLSVHVGDPVGGTAIEFVGETHDVPQGLQPGSTSVEVVFTQVDTT